MDIWGDTMQITGKQRSYLKSLSHHAKPLLQIGKAGVTAEVIAQLNELLEDHELVKITVLNNSDVDLKTETESLLAKTDAIFVQQIGHKLTLYRPAKEPKIQLP